MFSLSCYCQTIGGIKHKLFIIPKDTLVLDSLSLIPGSVNVTTFPTTSDTNVYKLNYSKKQLILKKGQAFDSIKVVYKTFPYNFEASFYHKDPSILKQDISISGNPYTITFNNNQPNVDLFKNDGLTKNGSVSRGITFGNNQDVVVNSNLNLQVSGKLTPEIDLLMAATDNNIPFQPEGTTAQLQEFDKVFIQLNNQQSKLIVGDFQLSRPKSYFMNFYKRSQGAYFSNNYNDTLEKTPIVFKTQLSGAVSRGRFARNVIQGTENNQGPYRLRGSENESFIIVLSGTEKIYIDGKLLQRGQENDYIIDYNTSEVTFTARQIITKDKRIVAEFQYAERSYARSLYFFGEDVELKKLKLRFNLYNEQDNKNKTLQQALTPAQQLVLFNIGDTINKAFSSGAELSTFNSSEVFYWKKDTIVNSQTYKDIYVYSTNADSAKYRVKYSYVGEGSGHYRQVSSSANGKVYQWFAPVGGVLQGNYEPIILLVTPKQKQMATVGLEFGDNPNHTLSLEGVYTKNDINTFSRYNANDDNGYGFKLMSKHESVLKLDSSTKTTHKAIYNVGYEYVQKYFSPIERYRAIEFERDWNRSTANALINTDQHVGFLQAGIEKEGSYKLLYGFNTFLEGSFYKGIKHQVQATTTTKRTTMSYDGSLLNSTSDPIKTGFYRHKTVMSQKVGKVRLTYLDEFERNIFQQLKTDSLLARTYQFWEWEGNITNVDSSGNIFKLFYRERRDKQAYSNVIKDSTYAQNVGASAAINSIKNHPLSVLFTYRELHLKNTISNLLKPDNTLLGRLEYSPRLIKGFITSTLFYETGYGLENKKEYYYIEVPPGQGAYAWKDYNDNGVKELNEFEIAQFSDQSIYIRVYTPTNQYVKVLHDQFSFSLNLRPSVFQKEESSAWLKSIGRFATQTVYRLDKKMLDNGNLFSFNPLDTRSNDTLLQALNYSFRQSIFFNQNSAVFGVDYTFQDNRTKQLLTNGLETRTNYTHEVRWRWNITRAWSLNSINSTGIKTNASQFFSTRNYAIEFYDTEQRLSYQPSTAFRMSAIYKYNKKQNIIEGGFQKSVSDNYGLELKYNELEKGSLTGRADFIMIRYNDAENTSLAYEMLNALKPGKNYTWNLNYQRNLSNNIQISITYDGRKSENSNVVHIGGAQIRAFF